MKLIPPVIALGIGLSLGLGYLAMSAPNEADPSLPTQKRATASTKRASPPPQDATSIASGQEPEIRIRDEDNKNQGVSFGLHGYVRDRTGRPIVGAVVQAIRPHSENWEGAKPINEPPLSRGKNPPPPILFGITDPAGHYALPAPATKSWRLSVDFKGYAAAPSVEVPGDPLRADFWASPVVKTAVTITDGQSQSYAAAKLRVSPLALSDRERAPRRLTGPFKQWRADSPTVDLPVGLCLMQAEIMLTESDSFFGPVEIIEVLPRTETPSIVLRYDPRFEIRGEVLMKGSLLSEWFRVELHPLLNELAAIGKGTPLRSQILGLEELETGFVFAEIPPGQYELQLFGVRDELTTPLSRRIVDLTRGSVLVALTPGGSFDSFQVSCRNALGEPVTGARLQIENPSVPGKSSIACALSETTLADKRTVFYQLHPGQSGTYSLVGFHPILGTAKVELEVPVRGDIALTWPVAQTLKLSVRGIRGLLRQGLVEVVVEADARESIRLTSWKDFDANEEAVVTLTNAESATIFINAINELNIISWTIVEETIDLHDGVQDVQIALPKTAVLSLTAPSSGTQLWHELTSLEGPEDESSERLSLEDSFMVPSSKEPQTITLGPLPLGKYAIQLSQANGSSGARIECDLQADLHIDLREKTPNALAVTITNPQGIFAAAGLRSGDRVTALNGTVLGHRLTPADAIALLWQSVGPLGLTLQREGQSLVLSVDGTAVANDPDLGGANFESATLP